MKIKHMKFLDKYAGYAACVVLTAFGRAFGSGEPAKIDKGAIRKVLVMKFWGLGSILLLSPAIAGIREEFPGARIVLFTSRRNSEICSSLGIFDEVRYLDVDRGWLAFAASLLRNMFRLFMDRFDMVVDFEFFTRFSAVLTFFTFSPIRVGYHAWEAWRGDIHNIKVPFNRYWNIMDNFYNLGTYIGVAARPELRMARPRFTEEDRAFVDGLLGKAGVSGGYIAANVNASDLVIERRWPYENFVELARRLLEKFGSSIVFVGSPSERPGVDAIVKEVGDPRAVNLAGMVSIPQLARLFEGADLVISNDSGPLHLAVAMGTPTVSLFGPETPAIYGPKGKEHTVIFKNIDCSPCCNVHDRKSVHCYWEKPRCMSLITVAEVFEAIERALSGPAAARGRR
ncbi:MAG TPA: glycosyltransferase family 9 protein [Elusimicrobiales bacterium]|nr:glycosyltransferase family 9 protein [Elusimicrobiales bacterium]